MATLGCSKPIHVPQEIVDHIVDLTINKDAKALRSCSLLSKAFSIPFRRHTFSKIHIGSGPDSQKSSERLLVILKQRSGPLVFVKSLIVILELEAKMLHAAISCLTLRENPFFGPVLKMLSQANLENLTIDTSGEYLDWNAPNKETLSIFTLLRSKPPLKSLRICMVMNLWTSFLLGNGAQNQIECLDLIRVLFARSGTRTSRDASSLSSPTRIKSLALSSTTLTVQAPSYFNPPRQPATAPFQMSSLRRLIISSLEVQTEVETLWQLMLSASQSLEYLEMKDVVDLGSRITFPAPFELHQLSSLRSLKLRTYQLRTHQLRMREGRTEQLMSIIRFLKTTTSPSSLETITIALSWDLCRPGHRNWLVDPRAGWLALDEALASPCFPSLKTVRVELELMFLGPDIRWGEDNPKVVERPWADRVRDIHFKEMLPSLSSSARVLLDVQVDIDFEFPMMLFG